MLRIAQKALAYLPFIGLIAVVFFLRDKFSLLQDLSIDLNTLVLASVALLISHLPFVMALGTLLPKQHALTIRMRAAGAGLLKPILLKYLPGKVWIYISCIHALNRFGIPTMQATVSLSLHQLLQLCAGVAIGLAFGLPLLLNVLSVKHMLLILLACLSLGLAGLWCILKLPALHAFRVKLLTALKALRDIPISATLLATLYLAMHWLLLGLSYALFFHALSITQDWSAIWMQPLAHNLGFLAVFTPGGLGVRDGATAAYLSLAGVVATLSITAALAARVWHALLEIILYLVGLQADKSSHP